MYHLCNMMSDTVFILLKCLFGRELNTEMDSI